MERRHYCLSALLQGVILAAERAAKAHELDIAKAEAILADPEKREASPRTVWARLLVLHSKDRKRAAA
jgi:hypothetical protein